MLKQGLELKQTQKLSPLQILHHCTEIAAQCKAGMLKEYYSAL